ncbi:hypothetical protein AQ915_20730 [Burkholderia pseudomallei]|uniref:DUF7673 family protein n=1 Tax=Burkholderia pseudomallei TaxID=28450 RepID=UPI0009789E5A|nr:hypothetical protein [Burkholderia pseudomallei]ONC30081.1 hypothetical protein AQ915_20730 [Burkholderia pseudomallei]
MHVLHADTTAFHRLLELAHHFELPEGRAIADLFLAWWHSGTFGPFNLQRLNAFDAGLRYAVIDFLTVVEDGVTPAELGVLTDLEVIAGRRAAARTVLH